ncbi:hypothetical protein BDP27DRAFT_389676 [Rhodocollybia butyracea]|uniref:HMG box domain-containing protein n=1 Tax=Rhodocollybia butyracea TaxID=206335 RepID=A0A9P5Q0H7_9AGAR|nr:hypothetical protein BDP27DRAFT_389676 [Rhodocollybia butyracea]
MPKSAPAATSKTTKQASKNTAKEPKEKRPPSAYNVFVKEQLPIWKSEHPDVSAKEAMKGVRALWASAEENPKSVSSSSSIFAA